MLRGTGSRVAALGLAGIAILALVVVLGSLPSGKPSSSAAVGPSSTAPGSGAAQSALATEPGTAAATQSSPGKTPVASEVFVGAGDIADCSSDGDSQTAAILDEVRGTVFTLGDNAYEDGTRHEFNECYGPTWGLYLDRTRPSPGNHEYQTAGAAGYFEYFGERAGPDSRGWYAFDLGAWRMYSLNSNCDVIACGNDSRQLAWLRDDLATHSNRCTLAYWHHPRFSSGEHGNHAFMDPIWNVLYEAGTELVLAGHDHTYERFEPMNAGGNLDPDRGITSFVVGTGGRYHHDFVNILATSAARNKSTWGVLELTLSPDGWSARFIPVAGADFTDSASGTCR
jgi:Calcineurin-like phosphoesterase